MAFVEIATEAPHDWQCPTCRLAARAREGLLTIPNNPLVVAALQAVCAGGPNASLIDGGWRRSRAGAPVYEFWNGAGGRVLVRVQGGDADAWEDVRSYSSLTLDVAVASLAGLANAPFRQATCAPRREPVSLGAALVLNAKGYRRFGAERAAFAAVVAAERAKLERLRFDILSYPGFDPQSRKWRADGITRSDVALFECTEEEPCQAANDRRACAFERPLRFGAWADHWLNSSGVMWTASIPQEVMRFDHRENRSSDAIAKRIALLMYLTFGAARSAGAMRTPMRLLMRRIGMLPRLDRARPTHNGRVADRIEEALLRLSELGLLKATLHAETAAARRATSRPWFDEWLESEVVFERPTRERAQV